MSKKEFTYTLRIDAEINDLVAKTAKVRQSMQQVMDSGKAPGAEKIFTSIEHAIDRLRQKASTPITSAAAFSSLQKDTAAVSAQLVKLGGIIENLGDLSEAEKIDLLPADFKQRVKDAQAAVAAFATAYSAATTETKEMAEAQRDLAKAEREQKKAEGKVSEKTALIDATKAEITEIEKKKKALEKFLETQAAYEKAGANKSYSGDKTGKQELQGKSLPADRAAAKAVDPNLDLKDAEAVQARIQSLTTEIERAEQAQRRYETSLSEWEKKAQVAGQSVSDLEGKVDALNAEFEQNKAKDTQAAYAKLRTEAGKLGVDLTNIPLDYTEQNLKELTDALIAVKQQGLDQVHQGFDTFQVELNETAASCDKTKDSIAENKDTFEELDERARNTQAFAQRIKAFVGIQGAANLARRAFQNAFATVKELDKAMTEMAVVTELNVGDYWKQLPEYTDRANELGVSIKSAYESATLFYQQGLKTNEVVAMSNETLKMARIAGLSAEDATNKMTAALRGFNMELNETSAQRVADVYSELAAITASDVKEISSAMTKTASIASSAGMEFETTAAFLSQIIETTRESAETAGTALKTVIARFQELKKDPSEIGEVEGEIVDANKIETALRSVGVALRDSSGQFRELDEVFLELSSKWDGLDTNTQRYIATIAAGSRQQSRFIAMMSDYGRTQELVSAANTSAGASNKQFEKTMDSLESKLNQLKNSWDTFTMSLMNNELIKAGIDILTSLMNTINDVIAAFDKIGLGGAASIGMVVGALAIGSKAIIAFERHLLATNTAGLRVNGTFGALSKTVKGAFSGLFKSIKAIPDKLAQIGTAAKASAKGISKMHSPDFTKAQQHYNNLLSQEQRLDKARLSIKQKIDSQQEVSTAQKQHYAATEEIAARTTDKRVQAEYKLYAVMGLNEQQTKEAAAMTANGVGADTAAILAKYGITAATVAQGAATNKLKQEEYAEQLAQKLSNTGTVQGTISKLLNAAATKLQEKAEKGGIGAKAASTVATWLQTAANWALNASLGAIILVILAVVAAIALLIGIIFLVIAAVKKAQANSPEGKLKAAEEAAEAAADAANQAKEAYNGLADSFDNLADKYDALDELTQGTREWRDAVKEINGEVMDLIDKYPELAGLVTSEDGVLKIDLDSDEAQAVLDKYEQRSIQLNSAELVAKANVARAQERVNYKNLSNDAELGSQSGNTWKRIGLYAADVLTGGATIGAHVLAEQSIQQQEAKNVENTEKLAKALADGLVTKREDGSWQAISGSEEQLKVIGLSVEEANRFANELGDGAEELRKYGEAVRAREVQERALYEAMATNAQQLVDISDMTEEQIKQINTVANAEYAKFFEDQAKENIVDIEKQGMSKGEWKGWIEKETKNLYGPDITDVKAYNDGSVTYKDKEGNDHRLSYEEFKNNLAASEGTAGAAESLAKLPETIDKISDKLGKAGKTFEKAYYAKEGGALTRGEVNELKNNKQNILDIYNGLTKAEQDAFGGFENFKKHIEDSITLAEQAFVSASATLTEMGGRVEYNAKMDAESAKGYADQLEKVMSNAGQTGINSVNNALNVVANKLSEEDFAKFMGQINALDWKSMEDWEKLPETLEAIGISIPSAALEEFVNQAQTAAGAIRNIDLDKLNEQLQGLQNIGNKIKTGEQGRTFGSSEYESLVAMDSNLASQFQQTLSGEFVYLGKSMADLTQAISENTDALLGQAIKQLQNKIDAAQIIEIMADNQTWSNGREKDIADWRSWEEDSSSETSAKTYLKDFIKQSKSEGLDLTQLGIAGLSNYTPVDSLSKEQIEEIMDSLIGVFNNLNSNIETLSTKTINSLSLIYQTQGAELNSQMASEYRNKVANGAPLSTEQQEEFKAYTNTIATQAQVAGINKLDIEQYTKAITSMEELSKMYQEGQIDLEQYKDLYASFTKIVEEFERNLVNKTNLNLLNQNLGSSINRLGELNEQFKNTEDKASKIEIVSKMVEDLGITIDETNYEYIQSLIDTTIQGGEQGFTAFQTLITQAALSYGLTVQEMAQLTTQTWSNASTEMTESMWLFVQALTNFGIGAFEELTNDSTKFYFGTLENLNTAANSAGTLLEAWENPYDWIYNFNEENNNLLRERERLERRFSRTLAEENSSAAELLDITKQEIESLKEQAALQGEAIIAARQEISTSLQNAGSKFSQYIKYDSKTNTIVIDENADFNTEEGEEFDELVATITENRDIILDAENALYDIQDSLDEIKQRGREETSELYNQIKEGLIVERQTEIDKLSEINDSIQEAQSNLIDKIQEQIDDARQARENEKAEQDISDKQTRLAYLMRDTSGGNEMEIASLQKEIAEAQEGYIDNLVDQSLAELQDANEKAAEQRQHQIDIAQAQLEAYANSTDIWTKVKTILDNSLTQMQNGVPFVETEAGKLAQIAEEVDLKNPIEAEEFNTKLSENAKMAVLYNAYEEDGLLDTAINDADATVSEALTKVTSGAGKEIEVDGNDEIKTNTDNNATISSNTNTLVTNTSKIVATLNSLLDVLNIIKNKPKEKTNEEKVAEYTDYFQGIIDENNISLTSMRQGANKILSKEDFAKWQEYTSLNSDWYNDLKFASTVRGETKDTSTPKMEQNGLTSEGPKQPSGKDMYDRGKMVEYVNALNTARLPLRISAAHNQVTVDGEKYVAIDGGEYVKISDTCTVDGQMYANFGVPKYKKYKTGGLADFTGPAWLDGTKSKPEIVLNQQDSANFLVLRDILSDILNGTTNLSKTDKKDNGGDNYYDIEINVESLGDDYDVEQLADKIRSMIYDDATYRNVNSVNKR